ncbi:MAG TPA: carboxypeptidase-like regulatory domain-containing protein, partial [Vicinamibacterales bacterium]|nr:carboxypeptidase-like regulatory domain-containing protein [Vicinamibacterales bacterium]
MTVRIDFQVQDATGRGIPGRITCTPPTPADPGAWSLPTGPTGFLSTQLTPGRYHGEINAPGYVTATREWLFGSETPIGEPVRIGLDAASGAGRLSASATGFLEADGRPYTWAMVDSFRLAERLYFNEDIDSVLNQIVDTGANGVRLLNDAEWYRIYSKDIPGFFSDVLPRLAVKLTDRTLYCAMCCFGDWQQTHGGDLNRALLYWQQCIAVARAFPCYVLQLVNEGDQHGQNFPFEAFAMPDGVLSSRGSAGTGNNPPAPYGRSKWTFNSLGTERNEEKIALSTTTIWWAINGYRGENGQPDYPGTQWMTVVDEPPKIGTGAHTDPALAYLLGLGTRFHPSGKAGGGTAHAE